MIVKQLSHIEKKDMNYIIHYKTGAIEHHPELYFLCDLEEKAIYAVGDRGKIKKELDNIVTDYRLSGFFISHLTILNFTNSNLTDLNDSLQSFDHFLHLIHKLKHEEKLSNGIKILY